MIEKAKTELSKSGKIRFGINLGNMLLVPGQHDDGTPFGVSPDMAVAISERLDLDFELVTFDGAGATADAISSGRVDIGLIAYEAKRAETIAFSNPYCCIEASYLVPEASPFQTVDDVDQEGVRIALSGRSAYDLYLSRTLKHAELCRADGIPAAFEMYKSGGYDALACIKPALLDNLLELPNSRILEGSYTSVLQSLGTQPKNMVAVDFLNQFVKEMTSSGRVEQLINAHNMTGKLSVAP